MDGERDRRAVELQLRLGPRGGHDAALLAQARRRALGRVRRRADAADQRRDVDGERAREELEQLAPAAVDAEVRHLGRGSRRVSGQRARAQRGRDGTHAHERLGHLEREALVLHRARDAVGDEEDEDRLGRVPGAHADRVQEAGDVLDGRLVGRRHLARREVVERGHRDARALLVRDAAPALDGEPRVVEVLDVLLAVLLPAPARDRVGERVRVHVQQVVEEVLQAVGDLEVRRMGGVAVGEEQQVLGALHALREDVLGGAGRVSAAAGGRETVRTAFCIRQRSAWKGVLSVAGSMAVWDEEIIQGTLASYCFMTGFLPVRGGWWTLISRSTSTSRFRMRASCSGPGLRGRSSARYGS